MTQTSRLRRRIVAQRSAATRLARPHPAGRATDADHSGEVVAPTAGHDPHGAAMPGSTRCDRPQNAVAADRDRHLTGSRRPLREFDRMPDRGGQLCPDRTTGVSQSGRGLGHHADRSAAPGMWIGDQSERSRVHPPAGCRTRMG